MSAPVLHPLEREVMTVVWAHGEATVRTVLDVVNAGADRPRAYTTVMTIMHRLHDKQMLGRRREGRRDVYFALLDERAYRAARAGAEVEALLAEFGDVALAHFARELDDLDPARLEALRRLAGG